MTPEEKARCVIDDKLRQSGWVIGKFSGVTGTVEEITSRSARIKSNNVADRDEKRKNAVERWGIFKKKYLCNIW